MKLLLLLFVSALPFCVHAQFNLAWQGKKAAVVITYDDAIDQHLDHALPLLDSLQLKATFYVTGFSPSMQRRLAEWKQVAARGHELGNHTMYHPCNGDAPGREWVQPDYDLSRYTVKRMVDETRATNLLLQSMDGRTKRTFAYTCGDMKIGNQSFINELKNDFVAARAVRNQIHGIGEVDLYDVDCHLVNNHTAAQMIAWVDEAIEKNGLLVILFHGVGGGNSLDVSLKAHRELLQYLKLKEQVLWVAPMVEVATHIREWKVRDSARAELQRRTEADYRQMLATLNIKSVRPGPSGNPQAPNAANTDESKAGPFAALPDPLVQHNGNKVTTATQWWKKRRPEIVEAFNREVYGRIPEKTPAVRWQVVATKDTQYGSIAAVEEQLLGHVDNAAYPQLKVAIQLSVVRPKAVRSRVPVVMSLAFVWPANFRTPSPAGTPAQKSWQEQVLERGWAAAVLIPTSFQADNGAGLTEGIIGLVNKGQPRKPDDWGTLRAWAWGAGRAIDYFATHPLLDASRVAIEGLSRYGKAALVTMAFEPRIKVGFIGSSGAGGAKILRRVYGEQVENLASSAEYHWFAGNFIRYAGPLTPNDLPVDAHQLIALCAPRPVFISAGSPKVEGHWIDAKGMFLGTVNAGPVYRLLGVKDLGTAEYPAEEELVAAGSLAFRQHSGGHTTGPNWPYFLDFAARHFAR